MKTIKWLTSLAHKDPILALVTSLFIGIFIMGLVTRNIYNTSQSRDKNCEQEKQELQNQINDLNRSKLEQERNFRLELTKRLDDLNKQLENKIDKQERINENQKKIQLQNHNIIKSNKQTINKLNKAVNEK